MEEITAEMLQKMSAEFREELKKLEKKAREFISLTKNVKPEYVSDKWECIAQATLGMRKIESARMKYWKVIQYSWNWESCFDEKKENNETERPEGCQV